jgi:hypothetical protein
MLPLSSVQNVVQCLRSNAVFLRHRSAQAASPDRPRIPPPSHLQDLRFGQSCSSIGSTTSLAFFANHVCAVLCIRTQEQMFRTNTGTIITSMQNSKPIRDRSEMQPPRDAVHSVIDPVSPETAIPRARIDFCGFPTGIVAIKLDDTLPEANCYGIMPRHRDLLRRGVAPPIVSAMRGHLTGSVA